MKKLFLIILILGLSALPGAANMAVNSNTSSPGCSSTATCSQSGSSASTRLGELATSYRVGGEFSFAAAGTYCRFDIGLSTNAGDISGYNWTCYVYTLSGTSLGTLVATSDNTITITGSNDYTFNFASGFSVNTTDSYAIFASRGGVSSENYGSVLTNYPSSDATCTAVSSWQSDGTRSWTDTDRDLRYALYPLN